ncbi:MAG TPA: hypothetical protein VN887_07850 [Candidatus Angelobacter sp.]|nr:hypothetical protein [Candidatus Angelobacter sp.]
MALFDGRSNYCTSALMLRAKSVLRFESRLIFTTATPSAKESCVEKEKGRVWMHTQLFTKTRHPPIRAGHY